MLTVFGTRNETCGVCNNKKLTIQIRVRPKDDEMADFNTCYECLEKMAHQARARFRVTECPVCKGKFELDEEAMQDYGETDQNDLPLNALVLHCISCDEVYDGLGEIL